jgi:hypothetical protein
VFIYIDPAITMAAEQWQLGAALGAGAAIGAGAVACWGAAPADTSTTIGVGSALVGNTSALFNCSGDKPVAADLGALFGGKKAILMALPGAFTPG